MSRRDSEPRKKKKQAPGLSGASTAPASSTGPEEALGRADAATGRVEVEEEHTAPSEPRQDLPPETPAGGESEARDAALGGEAAPPEAPEAEGGVEMAGAVPPRSPTPTAEASADGGAAASPARSPARRAPEEEETARSPPRQAEEAAPSSSKGKEVGEGPEAGPSQVVTAGGGSEPRTGWALQLVSDSAVLKRGSLQSARAALDALEEDLQAEEAHIAGERLRLADGWRQLNVAIRLGRLQEDAARERREKDAKDAQELRDGAIRDAAEAIRRLEEVEAAEKALLAETASKKEELRAREDALKDRQAQLDPLEKELSKRADDLAAREAQIAKDAEALAARERDAENFEARAASREEGLVKREEEVAARERDADVREEELTRTASEQTLERERLTSLDRQVAAAQNSYDERLKKANAQLAEREQKCRADAEKKIQDERAALTQKHREKLKFQETRFTKKQGELTAEISRLKKQLGEAETARQQALAAKADADAELDSFRQQVGGVSDVVEKAREDAVQALGRQHERAKMFRALMQRARAAISCFTDETVAEPLEGNDAGYLDFFTKLVAKLEEGASTVDERVEGECRDALSQARRASSATSSASTPTSTSTGC